jgi:adenylosuccinate lyase
MPLTALTALSPLDGRYARQTDALRGIASEYGLIYYRLVIEIRWLQALSEHPDINELTAFTSAQQQILSDLLKNFDVAQAEKVKQIERTTNHDVKALEYYIKDKLSAYPEFAQQLEFVHFACTSEDINNLAYAMMLNDLKQQVLVGQLNTLIQRLSKFAHTYANLSMLSRTHGQPASPTTLGKEFKNIATRLTRQLNALQAQPILGKINGAVGNFNAHYSAYPTLDWLSFSKAFVESLGLQWNPFTTQIEPHDYMAEYFDIVKRINTIAIDSARDMWGYISLKYFKQKVIAGEVGSSTMPHKINPIDFENAEGNLGLANALLGHLSEKLPCSRWQRDLTDSTVLRNIGVAIGYSHLGLTALLKGLNKLEVDPAMIAQDLAQNWEVLAEAAQTVMRRYGIEQPYEKLKALTRGQRLDATRWREFLANLALPEAEKAKLQALTPDTYIGLAANLATQDGMQTP